jgi:type II secretory pathway predicted ATPase ExeA
MYESFYGLSERPFELTSNLKFLFYTAQHREALANLEYGLASAKAITVVTGEAGIGKTTILRAALQSQRCRHIKAVMLDNPRLSREEFIRLLAMKLKLGPAAAESKAGLLEALEPELRARRARNEMTALIVDEAQSLGRELLEELRLLANIETPAEKLLPLVLVGQPELADHLNDPGLRQLKQRVALRCEITSLNLVDAASYIASRIRTAGGDTSKLFTREAVMQIHEASRGIPRIINVLCDNSLITGLALKRRPVDRDIVRDVCRDFDIGEEPAQAAAAGGYGDFVPRPSSRTIQGPPAKEPSIAKV